MDRYQATRRVAVLGITANILLLIAKLAVGILSRSQAMIADSLNSAGDVFASFMTYIGNRISSKPQDKDHPYGHGKAEYVFSMIISFSLLIVAYRIFRNSVDAVLYGSSLVFNIWLVGIAFFTIVLKFCLFLYTRWIGKKNDNLLIIANSEDHRNDVFVTSSALLGFYIGGLGISWVDGVVGIGISLWIAFTGIRIFINSYKVLMDTSINDLLKEDVIDTINSIDGVDHIDNIAAKPVGIGFLIIVKVSVPGSLSVQQGHSIAAEIREKVKKCKSIEDVVVHVNPT